MALSLNSEHFTEILSNVRPLEMIMQTLWWLEVGGGGGGGGGGDPIMLLCASKS